MRKASVCVDANICINALIAGPYRTQATALMERWSESNIRLIVPTLFDYEVVSALRRAVHMKQISKEAGEAAYQHYLHIPLTRQHNRRLLNLSWELANRFARSRTYDASYLAVAYLNRCDLWTANERLYNVVHDKLSWVKWVGEV